MSGLDIEYKIVPFLEWLFGRAAAEDGTGATEGAWATFWQTVLVLFLIGVLVKVGVLTVRFFHIALTKGFGQAGVAVIDDLVGMRRTITNFELFRVSPRRVWGLAMLAMRESFRRNVWVALVVFVLMLMFAGWVLNPDSDQPGTLYLNFVLSATTYLMFPVIILLGSFSLPNDIKNRTIYTVASKPVRASEVVMGRTLGFIGIGTCLLAVMAVCSYIFVDRGLDHRHELAAEDLERKDNKLVGKTSIGGRHRHSLSIPVDAFTPELSFEPEPTTAGPVVARAGESAEAAGLAVGDVVESIDGSGTLQLSVDDIIRALQGSVGSTVELGISRGGSRQTIQLQRIVSEVFTDVNKGHRHRVTARWSEDSNAVEYEVGPPEGMLLARTPHYGDLRFLDPYGKPRERGISVGDLYSYRSYIAGRTRAAAIWTFDELSAASYPDGLPLDMNIRIYRFTTGDIQAGIHGSLQLVHPDRQVNKRSREYRILVGGAEDTAEDVTAISKEFQVGRTLIPRQTTDPSGEPIDIFEDLVNNDGQVEVWLRCSDSQRYFGVGYADVYVRARDGSYTLNFAKAVMAIWLQMTIVAGLTVFFSTFLSGPIALLLSITVIILGFFKSKIDAMIIFVTEGKARMLELLPSHERHWGGGPLEATYRIITQMNQTSDLPDNGLSSAIKFMDYYLAKGIEAVLHLIPSFEKFDEVRFLSHGYAIQTSMLLQHVSTTLAFLIAAYILGYLMLKQRELAA
ncbi:MAG: PDZ domain-containing protein [Planctomycetota bacterium]|nr:PDZ domain-containing protein [Planctomycetota bacterium]